MAKPELRVADFYRLSWQLLLGATCVIAMVSGVVRPLVCLPCFLAAVVLISSVGPRLARFKTLIAWTISLGLVLLAVAEFLPMTRRGNVIGVLIEMICGAVPWLLLNYERPLSYWLALLNVVVIAVGSLTLGSSGVVYLGFVLLIVLVLLNMNAATLYLRSSREALVRDTLPSGYFRQFVYVLPVGLLSAVGIFFLFPRVQSFHLAIAEDRGRRHTGYSGLVDLTGGGALDVSENLAFLVEAKDHDAAAQAWLQRHGPELLWRGDALGHFDGVHWSPSVFRYRPLGRIADLRTAASASDTYEDLTIHLEPTSSAALFYPGVLLGLTDSSLSNAPFLMNANGAVIRDKAADGRFSYRVRTTAGPQDQELSQAPLADLTKDLGAVAGRGALPRELASDETAEYLAIPPSVADADYFRAWLKEVGLDPRQASVVQAEARLLQLFNSRFKATLANAFPAQGALAQFLGPRRAGHCEYFATTAALTLRALGLPTRLVVGYRGGTYNALVDVFEVREAEAHAWVEAFVPGVGWQAFDATPPGGTLGVDSWLSKMRLFSDGVGFWLRRYVIDYDQAAQRDLLRGLREAGRQNGRQRLAWRELLLSYGRFWGSALAVLLLAGVMIRVYRRRPAATGLPDYYAAFAARARRAGWQRRTDETFAQFHARLLAAGGVDADLQALASALERDLYGRVPTTVRERKLLAAVGRALQIRPAAVSVGRPSRR